MQSMTIRPETPNDYAHIHDLHIQAFEDTGGVSTLVALLRTRQSYDSDLALLAELDGVIVGHVMLNPTQLYLAGDILSVVNLSPIGIHPDYQKQGIGGQLIEHGHKIAREKGYDCSILLGHSDYYPRFGYHTQAYGVSNLTVRPSAKTQVALTTHPPQIDDLEALASLHQQNERAVNLSIVPESTLAEWVSPHPQADCVVYRHEGEIVGYTRCIKQEVKLFLAKDIASAQAIVTQLATETESIQLPLHPQSSCAEAFDGVPIVEAWQAAMICPLQAQSTVTPYLQAITDGAVVGRILWASCFDIA